MLAAILVQRQESLLLDLPTASFWISPQTTCPHWLQTSADGTWLVLGKSGIWCCVCSTATSEEWLVFLHMLCNMVTRSDTRGHDPDSPLIVLTAKVMD